MAEDTPQARLGRALRRKPSEPEPVRTVRHVQVTAGDLVELLKAHPDDPELAAVLKGAESLPKDRAVVIEEALARRLQKGEPAEEPHG